MKQLAWHYTTGELFTEIMESGLLMTTSAGCPEHERPVLWFSMNQRWEPTANKAIIDDYGYRGLTMQETKEYGRGLVRFGFPYTQLVPWIKLWKEAGMLPEHKRALEKTGRKQGANPYHWHGVFRDIPVSEILVVEVMNDKDQWERVQVSEAVERKAA